MTFLTFLTYTKFEAHIVYNIYKMVDLYFVEFHQPQEVKLTKS